ncbi:hypothetical protein IV203_014920 [Nitzschia inconspicua]|uniref:Uncharacterized protein n=1 Tax=Nitzschia inconspicua TaxID=303405 RepID=A0A9K3PSS2_9STRA|nr:hypothetical protein IV203_014920 [Nitzschia inconspicua]
MPNNRKRSGVETIGQNIVDQLLSDSGGSLARSWKRADRRVFCDVAVLPILKNNIDGSKQNRIVIQRLNQKLRLHLREQCQGRLSCQRILTEARIAANREISDACLYEITNRERQIKFISRQSRSTILLLVSTIRQGFRHVSCQRQTRFSNKMTSDLEELGRKLHEEKIATRHDRVLRAMAMDPVLDGLDCHEKATMFLALTNRFQKSRKERCEREEVIMAILERIATR